MADLSELSKLMIEHGLIIRAIPYERTFTVEMRHKGRHPDGVVYFDEVRKSKMLRVTESNPRGGQFIITQRMDQGTVINYWGRPGEKLKFYDSIEEAIKSFI